MEKVNFKIPEAQSAVEYVHTPWTKALLCWSCYDKYGLNGTFIKGLKQATWRSTRSYWAKSKLDLLQEPVPNILPLASIQSGNPIPEWDNEKQAVKGVQQEWLQHHERRVRLRLCKLRRLGQQWSAHAATGTENFRTIGGGIRPITRRLHIYYSYKSGEVL